HRARSIDNRRESHLREDVALDVDARRNFHQFHAARSTPEHAALRDVQDRLALLGGIRAVERDLLDPAHKLLAVALAHDAKHSIVDRDFKPAGSERTCEHDPARVLADVDKAAGAGESRAEATDVDVAVGVDLSHPKTRHVKPAAIVEIELLALLDNGVGIHCSSEIKTALR